MGRILLVCLCLIPSWLRADSLWAPASSNWRAGERDGSGRSAGPDWDHLLSQEWYGDFSFSGAVNPRPQAAVVFRHAGRSEGYALVLDARSSRVLLREDHLAESRNVLDAHLRGLAPGSPVKFRLEARNDSVTIALQTEGGGETRLTFADLKVPEGRIGFGVQQGEVSFAGAAFSGTTASQFKTYALHCNYKLAEKVSKEPVWQYLDAVGSSLLTRYQRQYRTVTEFEARRKDAVVSLRRSVGLDPWPERNPLNARITGTVERNDFRIEKIVFESQPGFLVNALLYVPKKSPLPAPAVLSTIGHWGENGFFLWMEQARCIGLARKGYVVLTYDPIGQGERKWLGNGNHDTLRRKIVLSGMEVSGLMFWDSIRALDYLVSRPEVDASRIGVTGVSGGGFNTMYTSVLDERVKAAVPNGFATSLEALIKRGSAGCCAYVPNLARYAEFEDIYSFIAPKKMLLLGGQMDVLSDRILPVFEAARSAYQLYGQERGVSYFIDRDAGHAYTKPMRLAMYRWFNKWLKGVDDPAAAFEPDDPENGLISRESGSLTVLPSGERGKDVIDLQREYLKRNQVKYEPPANTEQAGVFQNTVRKHLLELMGDLEPAKPPVVASDDRQTGPASVRRMILKTERDLPVGVSVHHPIDAGKSEGLILYFSMEERYPTSDVKIPEMVSRLTGRGFTVAVPEVRGTGATRAADANSVALFSMALGKHLFSTRIYDLARVADYLLAQPQYRSLRLILWGEGMREGAMALYLAAIDPRFQTVVSSHGLVSYQDIVDKDGLPDFDYYVPGILRYADLPHMAGAVAPRQVIVSAPVDINGKVVPPETTEESYRIAAAVYRAMGRPEQFSVVRQLDLIGALNAR